jgi:hypothetical protein
MQKLDGGKSYSAPDLGAALVSTASFRTGPLRFGLDLSAGVHAFRLDGNATVRPAASLALIVLYGL